MKSLQIVVVFMISIINTTLAQIGNWIPQYGAYYHAKEYQGQWDGGSNVQGVCLNLYPKGSFTAPAGKITTIYTTGNCYNESVQYNDHFTISMGYTTLGNFDSVTDADSTQVRSIVAGLTQVLTIDSIKTIDTTVFPDMYPGDSLNRRMWVKMTLYNPFMYDPSKNLLICAKPSREDMPNRFLFRITYDSVGVLGSAYNLQHEYLLEYNPIAPFFSSLQKRHAYMDLGFDLEPTGVNEAYSQYKYRVYPNPASAQLWGGWCRKNRRL